jgi:hypothetical protein
MKTATRLRQQSHRSKKREHHIGRPGMRLEVRADRAARGRMFSEPGKEIEMRDRGTQQIDRNDPVAITIERQRVGGGFGEHRNAALRMFTASL